MNKSFTKLFLKRLHEVGKIQWPENEAQNILPVYGPQKILRVISIDLYIDSLDNANFTTAIFTTAANTSNNSQIV